ncbi:unnamed protein product [Moneuplotes crassus]|uniref:Uncharacterized protein n=1 Tax=Euplotes crassus TaxID=5936 RepID=A0AAD1USI2_EUPCR|nr:unnamed protein product [Moneuplotes crassus]
MNEKVNEIRKKRNQERQPTNDKLDWYNFETKIRKLIHELIQPTVASGIEANESITKVTSKAENMEERILKLESELWKTEKQNTAYHRLEQRLNDHDSAFDKIKEEVKQEVGNLEKADAQIRTKMKNAKEEVNEIVKVNERLTESISKIKDDIINHVDTLNKSINTGVQNIEDEIQDIRFSISLLQESNKSINSSLATQREQLAAHEASIDNNISKNKEALVKIEGIQATVCLKEDFEKAVEDMKSEAKNCIYSLQDVSSNLEETDLYIEKYLPVRTQEMINESFKELAQSDLEKERICNYEVKRYKELHKAIINMPELNLNKKPTLPSVLEMEKALSELKKRNQLIKAHSPKAEDEEFKSF